MGAQEIAVIILFILSLAYAGRVIYRNIKPSSSGCSQCSKCAVDFSKIKTDS